MGAEKERPEAEEIEITPEMIEAGAHELWGWLPADGSSPPLPVDDWAIRVFVAMARKSRCFRNVAIREHRQTGRLRDLDIASIP